MSTTSSIKHDSQGFLIGELIESSKDMLASQQAGVGVMRGIRADVSAIARAMGLSARASSAAQAGRSPSPGNNRSVAEPAGRASRASLGHRSGGPQPATAVTRSRDAGGRFVGQCSGGSGSFRPDHCAQCQWWDWVYGAVVAAALAWRAQAAIVLVATEARRERPRRSR